MHTLWCIYTDMHTYIQIYMIYTYIRTHIHMCAYIYIHYTYTIDKTKN